MEAIYSSVSVVEITAVVNHFAVSTFSLSGRRSIELELHPSGHQTNQLG